MLRGLAPRALQPETVAAYSRTKTGVHHRRDSGDAELKNRLAVYTFRMCTEAIKVLIEKSLPDLKLFCWDHSTGGEYFYLLEQYGLKNKLIGGLGFGTGMPAWIRKEMGSDLRRKISQSGPSRSADAHRPESQVAQRATPKSGYVGPNQPWGSVERWFRIGEITDARNSNPTCGISSISAHDVLLPEIRKISGLPEDELFITYKADLNRLRGKKCSVSSASWTKGHSGSRDGGEKGTRISVARSTRALKRFAPHVEALRLILVPNLTHYGHVRKL